MNSKKLIQPVGIPLRAVKELEYEIAKLSKLRVVITSHLYLPKYRRIKGDTCFFWFLLRGGGEG